MVLGFNFMTSSGLKVFLSRNDLNFNETNPYACLYDKSCFLAHMSEKNVLAFNLILTTGSYKLTFFEFYPMQATESASLFDNLSKPISVKL